MEVLVLGKTGGTVFADGKLGPLLVKEIEVAVRNKMEEILRNSASRVPNRKNVVSTVRDDLAQEAKALVASQASLSKEDKSKMASLVKKTISVKIEEVWTDLEAKGIIPKL